MQDQFGLPPIKRPAVPRPVVVDGVRYSLRLSHPTPGRTRGALLAHDARTGELRWTLTLFEDTTSDDNGPIAPAREFVSFHCENGDLIVKDKRGKIFVVNIATRQVL